MRRKAKTPLTVVVWDLYPAFGSDGDRGYKRASYQWTPGHAWNAIYRWLFGQHGNTDLRYTVMEGGKVTKEGNFLRYY